MMRSALARDDVRRTLNQLGTRRLLLAIHDVSFPSAPEEEIGRGTPYGVGARRFLEHVVGLGFDGLQLGPQGEVSRGNPSPYDASAFERSRMSIALWPLAHDPEWRGLLPPEALASWRRPSGFEAEHEVAYDTMTAALETMRARAARFEPELAAFEAEMQPWLPNADAETIFRQFLAHRQHDAWHARCRALGASVFGDLQIGYAPEDAVRFFECFLADWKLGAPPSRTNPDGQPWGYPVFDPDAPEAASAFLAHRIAYLQRGLDGLRVDHPHGLICPWVYREGEPVREGGRLFASPDRADLARYAIVGEDQIDPTQPRHGDDWVRSLTAHQIDRYARLFDTVVDAVGAENIICEVLSTQPRPLAAVMARHGLGRFRVTQKADVTKADDVYLTANARPADWVMMGTHDTATIWRRIASWREEGAHDRPRYLADRLRLDADALFDDPVAWAHAELADLFASDAENVMIFFADLYGLTASYNQPGVVSVENWRLRVPPDWERRGPALDIERALAIAVAARA